MKNKDILAMEKAKIVEKMNQAIKDTLDRVLARLSRNSARKSRRTSWSRQEK